MDVCVSAYYYYLHTDKFLIKWFSFTPFVYKAPHDRINSYYHP